MVAMSFGTCRRHETVAEEKAALDTEKAVWMD